MRSAVVEVQRQPSDAAAESWELRKLRRELYDEAHALPIPSTLHISPLRDCTQRIDKPLEMSISIENNGGIDEVLKRYELLLHYYYGQNVVLLDVFTRLLSHDGLPHAWSHLRRCVQLMAQ